MRKLWEQGYGDVGESYGGAGVGLGLRNWRSWITQLIRQLTRCQNLVTMHGLYTETCMILSFRHEVGEKCALLGYYKASSGNFLPTFRDNLSVQSSRVNMLLGFLAL
jgi:hypothetical protein